MSCDIVVLTLTCILARVDNKRVLIFIQRVYGGKTERDFQLIRVHASAHYRQYDTLPPIIYS